MKWAEDELILRTFLRRIDDRRSPISNGIAIQNISCNARIVINIKKEPFKT
ncbi:MAG: hypothetical protein FWC89_03585 [Defluviitaleaceae bacterium]|nr:hypothetical protein [Defluviitaleaceae bacterium]